jgi:hypothetical protein
VAGAPHRLSVRVGQRFVQMGLNVRFVAGLIGLYLQLSLGVLSHAQRSRHVLRSGPGLEHSTARADPGQTALAQSGELRSNRVVAPAMAPNPFLGDEGGTLFYASSSGAAAPEQAWPPPSEVGASLATVRSRRDAETQAPNLHKFGRGDQAEPSEPPLWPSFLKPFLHRLVALNANWPSEGKSLASGGDRDRPMAAE